MPGLQQLFSAYIIDLDGTVYQGDQLLPTASQTVLKLRSLKRKVVFITNEASRTRVVIAGKLSALGIPTNSAEVINSSLVTTQYLKQKHAGATLYIIGEPSLVKELQSAGFTTSKDPQKIQVVVASSDHNFNYNKLRIAFDAIRLGAYLIATNADRTCPLADGSEEPDALPILAAIEACTNHPLDILVGKPSLYMAEAVLDVVGVTAQDCLLVGDNPETDIRMGKGSGMHTALIGTGIARNSSNADTQIQADFQIHSLADLLPKA